MSQEFKRKHFAGFTGQIVSCWAYRNGSVILLSTHQSNDRKSFDLREWYHDGTLFRPTKRGLRIPCSKLDALFIAVKKLRNEQRNSNE
jgi:hypothetical protein